MTLRVAIVDSGVDPGHPLLRGRARVVAPTKGLAADRDPLGHGTAVAATILQFLPTGADVEITSLRVFDDVPHCAFDDVLMALEAALAAAPALVNLSLGTTSLRYRASLQRLLARAAAQGTRLVAPAVFAGLPCDPGSLPGVEAVVADANVLPQQPELRPHAGRLLWYASPLPPRNADGSRTLRARGESLAVAAVTGFLLRRLV